MKYGKKYRFFGKISNKYGKIDLTSPVFDEIEKKNNTGKIIPLYPLTFSLSQNTIRKIIENGLKDVEEDGGLKETLPKYILNEYKLEEINKAIETVHFPKEFADFEIARKRFVFEELLSTQLALLQLKNSNLKDHKGISFSKDAHMSDVINSLPFNLTKAQLRVLEEIDKNMEQDKSMNRLLQGDVGSGKTVVAMISAYKAVKSGYQVAVLAPTAILATQHLENFQKILKKCNKKKLNIGLEYKEKKIIGELIDDSTKERKTDIIKCLKAVLIKEKREKIEYIYDQVCEELDEEFAKNNYCDFKDDVCIGKRNCSERVTMGCCHKFKHPITMNGELKECPYLVDKHCSTQCITCKLFTCDAIKVKFKLKDIPLIESFFNPIQKLIVKTNFFTKREKIIDRLVLFSM